MGTQNSSLGTGSYPYVQGDVLQLSIYFNGVEFPFTPASQLGYLHMSESSKIAIPMVRLQLVDGIDFLASNPGALVEGAQLTAVIIARTNDSFKRVFRVNSLLIEPNKSGNVIDLDGYLDYPKYWIETTNNHYMGQSTSQVLSNLAQYVGLSFTGIDTNDAQGWHGGLSRIHQFCTHLASHGYIDDASCMKRAVTLDGTFLYQNIATLDVASPKATMSIGTIEDGKLPIVSHLPRNLGGATNRRSGYRQTMLEYSMMRSSLYRLHTNLSVNVDEGGEVNLNSDVRSLLVQGTQMVGHLDYGNTNDSFHRAFYQNKRGSDLYNVGLDVVTPVPTVTSPGLTIFDTVSVEAPQEIQEQSGSYVVVSHAIMLDKTQYHEKFELARRSAASNAPTNVNANSYDSPSSNLYTDIS